ncbi:toxin co-regulated pilus biosynthesis Q family protein [Citrobacter koseri]|uniref:toxin co-regulated pilus biosynthesis Q family protein n=1 Tax=Citrobacter koseri TaxID=545 RepID=UPI001F44CCA6|nr:toxin co-regulated pilus biosynthesis Q family protein [Citrobacter koseri]
MAAAPSAVSRVTGPGPVIPPEPTVWLAQTGSTLKSTLKNWTTLYRCRGKDWFIFWPTPVDYPIDAPLQFSGDFRAALNGIFSLYKKADKPLYATVNPQQCVIQVSDRRGG